MQDDIHLPEYLYTNCGRKSSCSWNGKSYFSNSLSNGNAYIQGYLFEVQSIKSKLHVYFYKHDISKHT